MQLQILLGKVLMNHLILICWNLLFEKVKILWKYLFDKINYYGNRFLIH